MGELSDQLPGVSEAGPETERDGSPLRRARTYAGEVVRAIPIVQWAPAYRKRWLRPDVLAALAVWAVLVPQALAYASLAGVPAQAGLYAALAALLLYAIFGTSRELNVGPSSAIAALSAVAVAPLAGGDTATFVALSAMSAVLTGGILFAAGVRAARLPRRVLRQACADGVHHRPRSDDRDVAGPEAVRRHDRGRELLRGHLATRRRARRRETGTTFAVGASAIVVLVVLSRLMPKLPAGLDRARRLDRRFHRRSISRPKVSQSSVTCRAGCRRSAGRTWGWPRFSTCCRQRPGSRFSPSPSRSAERAFLPESGLRDRREQGAGRARGLEHGLRGFAGLRGRRKPLPLGGRASAGVKIAAVQHRRRRARPRDALRPRAAVQESPERRTRSDRHRRRGRPGEHQAS